MHLLVTRPEPDAGRLAAHLEALGYTVTRAPLMHIRHKQAAPDLEDVQALAFTSANGVRAFAASTPLRDLPVFAVGAATAGAARAAGFTDVEVAGGDVGSLAALIAARAEPAAGPVFHAAGSHVAGDLAQALSDAGIAVRRETLYEAQAEETLPPAAVRALKGEPRPLDGVLLFSPRSAGLFEKLVSAAGLRDRLKAAAAYCISPAAADVLTPGLWRRIAVAPVPDQTSLLALLPRPGSPGADACGRP
ncbi:MAG: uroporphyrinogen-III synthase [Alphaproteobacteria bacterium]